MLVAGCPIHRAFVPCDEWVSSIFARYLNTSESTVEKWESGVKKPSGMALKLLTIVQKHGLQMLSLIPTREEGCIRKLLRGDVRKSNKSG